MENEKEFTQKLFDENQYHTIFVGNEGNDESKDVITNLIDLLTLTENKDFKEEALLTLKREKAGDLLIHAIENPKSKEVKAIIVAACWESEINFSNNLPFFVELVMNGDYLVSLEAMTVIENMEGPFEDNSLPEAIKTLKKFKAKLTDEKQVLVNDLVDVLLQK